MDKEVLIQEIVSNIAGLGIPAIIEIANHAKQKKQDQDKNNANDSSKSFDVKSVKNVAGLEAVADELRDLAGDILDYAEPNGQVDEDCKEFEDQLDKLTTRLNKITGVE